MLTDKNMPNTGCKCYTVQEVLSVALYIHDILSLKHTQQCSVLGYNNQDLTDTEQNASHLLHFPLHIDG